MMPGVVAGFPASDLRVKTLTVGKNTNNPTWGFFGTLYGSISNDRLLTPSGSRIMSLSNTGETLGLTFNITGAPEGLTEASVLGMIAGLRIDSTVLSIESRHDMSISGSLVSISWIDSSIASPIGTTVGATRTVEVLYV